MKTQMKPEAANNFGPKRIEDADGNEIEETVLKKEINPGPD